MDFERIVPYDIRIEHTSNRGMVVHVGCAMMVYTSPKQMLLDLAEYYADPKGVEKKYQECMNNSNPQAVESAPRPDSGYGNTLAGGAGRTLRAPTVSATMVDGSQEEEKMDEAPEEEAPRLVPRQNVVNTDAEE